MIEYYFIKMFAVLRKIFQKIWDLFMWFTDNIVAKWYFLLPMTLISLYILGYWAYWMIKVILN